jgi:colanic acid/amylovoran biosynthesis glycosyltransferase
MDETTSTVTPSVDTRPHVVSLCGTYLKAEMQSIYRQITGLSRVRNTVFAQWIENAEMFPYQPLVRLTRLHHRAKGNFILRFWYKHVVKQWPPPVQINKFIGPCHPWDIVEQLRVHQPQLVHAYYGHKAMTYLAMLREWGGPWVVSFHGVDVSTKLEEKGEETTATLQDVFREAELVMARSESLLKRLAELGCPQDKLRINRTPIPMQHLTTSVRTPPENGQWRLVQACRLIPKKGLLTAIKAIAKVAAVYPQVQFHLCGTGPQEVKLGETISQLGLEKNVKLLGWLSQEQLHAEYHQAHLFLHPSEVTKDSDQEGVPNSMLEAMATGLPVVATRHGGIPEAVNHGEDGWLVAEKNADELSAAILSLFRSPEQLSKFSTHAATSVRSRYEAGAQVHAMEEVYLEAITRHHQRLQDPTQSIPA